MVCVMVCWCDDWICSFFIVQNIKVIKSVHPSIDWDIPSSRGWGTRKHRVSDVALLLRNQVISVSPFFQGDGGAIQVGQIAQTTQNIYPVIVIVVFLPVKGACFVVEQTQVSQLRSGLDQSVHEEFDVAYPVVIQAQRVESGQLWDAQLVGQLVIVEDQCLQALKAFQEGHVCEFVIAQVQFGRGVFKFGHVTP